MDPDPESSARAAPDAGSAARERIEGETGEHCAALWVPIGTAGARRFASLIAPITDAFTAAGTFQALHGRPDADLRNSRQAVSSGSPR
ncbi:helix-turn-helix domain-containing protein [Streptomyces longwoodensis]|uniref:helix-turn-helix domain-containing protein n=1 Tax=Streptomyces longwoodensis TaxID=68231 RepID=UPI003F4CF182